jgi:hypothetical protein
MNCDQAQYLTRGPGAGGHVPCSYYKGRALGPSLRCSWAQNPSCAVRIVVRWPCARGASALLAFGATSSVRGAREAVAMATVARQLALLQPLGLSSAAREDVCVDRTHPPVRLGVGGNEPSVSGAPTPCPQCQRRRPHDRGADDRRVSNRDSGLSAMSRSEETLARSSPGRLDRRAHFISRHSIVRSERRIVPPVS